LKGGRKKKNTSLETLRGEKREKLRNLKGWGKRGLATRHVSGSGVNHEGECIKQEMPQNKKKKRGCGWGLQGGDGVANQEMKGGGGQAAYFIETLRGSRKGKKD